jgi:predicted RNA-binding Zn ribbon-like protein
VGAEQNNGSRQSGAGRIYELVAGHPALDLVNTLDWRFREGSPEELLTSYADVLSFTGQVELMSSPQVRRLARSTPNAAAARVLATVKELREAAADVLYTWLDGRTPSPAVLKKLDGLFKEAADHQHLRWSESHMEWEFPPSPASPELPLWLLTASTKQLVTSPQMQMVRECGNSECRWLFLDTSKNHTRRWCDMKICGNRMKARRFKAQHRSATNSASRVP